MGMMPTIDTPSAGGVGSSAGGLFNQLLGFAPQQIQAQATQGPQYTQLSLEQLWNELMGLNGTPGYLNVYQNQVVPAMSATANAANTAARTAGVSDVSALGGAAGSAVMGMNPGQAALMSGLTKTATDQLNLGTQIDPQTANSITQSVRNNWASRGLGSAMPAQLDEAMQLYGGGQNLLAQRESTAGTVAGENQSFYSNPALSLVTAPSNAPQMGASMAGTGQTISSTAGPSLYPTSDLESLMNMVYNATSATNIGQANAQAGVESAMIGAGGSMGSKL